jgi:Cellulase (glycosyl hydrolase family 5)
MLFSAMLFRSDDGRSVQENSSMMAIRKTSVVFILALSFLLLLVPNSMQARERWTAAQAKAWSAHQPWVTGGNFLPSNAINQLEMWQAETFDAVTIDRELGWAEGVGMKTMRVFLHDLLWKQDADGMRRRMDTFLTIAQKHHIRPIFVFFDSCWDPYPVLGPQHPPIPGVHNSGWVQSPGKVALMDPAQEPRLEAYVKAVVGAFANDDRILAWDLWNEPDNTNGGEYHRGDSPDKVARVVALLPKVFEWARSANPTQPLTSGLWQGDWSSLETMSPTARIQATQSDVISFHNYGWPENFEHVVTQLEKLDRPILCTEYMARGAGSTFDTILPIAYQHHVGAINWGLVVGKSQTNLPWDSWQRPYVEVQPTVWFHDVFRADGTPYRLREVELLREWNAKP